jgi:hypothetical protein
MSMHAQKEQEYSVRVLRERGGIQLMFIDVRHILEAAVAGVKSNCSGFGIVLLCVVVQGYSVPGSGASTATYSFCHVPGAAQIDH